MNHANKDFRTKVLVPTNPFSILTKYIHRLPHNGDDCELETITKPSSVLLFFCHFAHESLTFPSLFSLLVHKVRYGTPILLLYLLLPQAQTTTDSAPPFHDLIPGGDNDANSHTESQFV